MYIDSAQLSRMLEYLKMKYMQYICNSKGHGYTEGPSWNVSTNLHLNDPVICTLLVSYKAHNNAFCKTKEKYWVVHNNLLL